jgi:hypothetical protein
MEVSFGVNPFSKIILHLTKYPEYFVNGVLLSKNDSGHGHEEKDSSSSPGSGKRQPLKFHEAIPLLHLSKYVTPSMEVALAQVEQHCKRTNQSVTGYYQANEGLNDNQPDFVASRIAEKLSEVNPKLLVLMINNEKVDSNLQDIPFTFYKLADGKLKEENVVSHLEPDAQGCLSTVSGLISEKIYEKLIDFDNHMDDISLDYWTNSEVNQHVKEYLESANC